MVLVILEKRKRSSNVNAKDNIDKGEYAAVIVDRGVGKCRAGLRVDFRVDFRVRLRVENHYKNKQK